MVIAIKESQCGSKCIGRNNPVEEIVTSNRCWSFELKWLSLDQWHRRREKLKEVAGYRVEYDSISNSRVSRSSIRMIGISGSEPIEVLALVLQCSNLDT